jgi:hypothetical protein
MSYSRWLVLTPPCIEDTMSRYQYPSFSTSTSVRLLVVSGTENEPRYTLEEVDLEGSPRYECLSYTWQDDSLVGGNERSVVLTIAGAGVLSITTNLANILRNIHGLLTDDNSPGRIWIDQICVNQEDLPERSQQVSLMQKIYGKAERTLIWTGGSNEHSAALLNIFWRLDDLRTASGLHLDNDLQQEVLRRLSAIFAQTGK